MPCTAREKFRRGQRVVPSPLGIERSAAKARRRGVVVGFSTQSRDRVLVRLDGNKGASAYHMAFWQPEVPED